MTFERQTDRVRRILVLVPWVIARGDPTVAETCERFGVTPEELSADLDLLMVCGLPPFGPGDLIEATIVGGVVSIRMADYLAEPPALTSQEALSLLVMGRAVAAMDELEDTGPLRGALDKLESAVDPETREQARAAADRIAVELASAGADLLPQVRAAAADRQRLHIVYYSQSRGELTERDVDPWLVFNALGYWYVVAFDHETSEERTFRVDRIKEATPTGQTFSPPEIDPARYARGTVFVPGARDTRAVIEVSPRAAWLREVIPAERAGAGRKGWTRIELRTAHFAWLTGLLLSAGPEARALEPPELVEEVAAAARAALARYAG